MESSYGGFENWAARPTQVSNYPFAVNLGFFRPNDVSPFLSNGQQATLENGLRRPIRVPQARILGETV